MPDNGDRPPTCVRERAGEYAMRVDRRSIVDRSTDLFLEDHDRSIERSTRMAGMAQRLREEIGFVAAESFVSTHGLEAVTAAYYDLLRLQDRSEVKNPCGMLCWLVKHR